MSNSVIVTKVEVANVLENIIKVENESEIALNNNSDDQNSSGNSNNTSSSMHETTVIECNSNLEKAESEQKCLNISFGTDNQSVLSENNEVNLSTNSKKRKYETSSSSTVDTIDSNRNGFFANKRISNGNLKGDRLSVSTYDSNGPDYGDVYVKFLIPAMSAGSVIGRGGERIAQIQKDANVKIKMSKANDYYPNTNERVCLIIGTVSAILKAHDYIVERIQEKSEISNKHIENEERINQIKFLVPNTSAGLLIGKAGAYIKQIKDESGAFVQISSKQTDLPERIVSIEGEIENRKKALHICLNKIAEDPQHNSVTNLSYSNTSNSESLSRNLNNQINSQNHKFDFNSAGTYLAGLNNLAMLIINSGGSHQFSSDSLKNSLRSAGFNSSSIIEIIDAVTVLFNYGLINRVHPTSVISGLMMPNTGTSYSSLSNSSPSSLSSSVIAGTSYNSNSQQASCSNHMTSTPIMGYPNQNNSNNNYSTNNLQQNYTNSNMNGNHHYHPQQQQQKYSSYYASHQHYPSSVTGHNGASTHANQQLKRGK